MTFFPEKNGFYNKTPYLCTPNFGKLCSQL